MANPKQTAGFLTLRHHGPRRKRKGNSLSGWKNYTKTIGFRFYKLALSHRGIKKSGNSADFVDSSGVEIYIVNHTVKTNDSALLESLSQATVGIVREIGIQFERRFELRKQIVLEGGDRDRYSKRIYPRRNTSWQPILANVNLNSKPAKLGHFPPRVKYLEEIANRCYGVGGNAVAFQNKRDLESFFANLESSDRDQLINAFIKIVERNEVDWYNKCSSEFSDQLHPDWSNKICWLFIFLDRLRIGGLLSENPRLQSVSVLPRITQ